PDGFGCTSCHQIGSLIPEKAPVNARGPNLSMLGARIRREWFERLVREPLRVLPGVEMPSLQIPVRGVLNNQLDLQIASLWKILNTRGFQPPDPNPIQWVRRLGIPEAHERAAVITDLVRADSQAWTHALLIGLPNRHNVIFDLETASLARWSTGDTAKQRTQGKSWYWEATGTDLALHYPANEPRGLSIANAERVPFGQWHAWLESWSHDGPALVAAWREQFRDRDGSMHHLRVRSRWEPLPGENWLKGWRWNIEVRSNVAALRWHLPSTDLGRGQVIDLKQVAPGTFAGQAEFALDSTAEQVESVKGSSVSAEGPSLPPPTNFSFAPGMVARRQSLGAHVMPTAIAAVPNGDLVIASLKGQVWRLSDRNADGDWGKLSAYSDELAAPYGLAIGQDHVDVCTKFGLLRLEDEDHDGRADRMQVLASGWGYTADYHDWMVGLPRDSEGNYYAAFACQQDQRSPIAALHRGQVVKLLPRQPTTDDFRLFSLETISAGHRFPMGIVRTRNGSLFVTDNQGNYNPFNELNHVQPNRHFGFINAIDSKSKARPETTPAAIEIPHPWTRSVNGLCVLESEAVSYGPWDGHLVGCEYDTRRLIRMSLQRVGETYQGAAYPLTPDRPDETSALLGPICAALDTHGELLIGSLRDSGWGGGNNIGELVRVRIEPNQLPAGIAEVRGTADGFELLFAKPVSREIALRPESYSISSYRRESTPAYGGPDLDRTDVRVTDIAISSDNRQARLTLERGGMKAGHVYEIHLRNLAGEGQPFHPADAYYTLRQVVR
ncbi:MAG: hypothetical protein RIS70_3341, partial [Planctomycetota bacterium]